MKKVNAKDFYVPMDKLRLMRLKKRLSMRDLSEKAKVAISSICSYENGQSKPQRAKLKALANALGCTVEEITED